MPVNTAWTKAGLTALKKLEQARHGLYAEAAGKHNSPDDLRQVYDRVRRDPAALVEFASRNVGPKRAMEEGERFLTAMRRIYGE